MPGRVLRLHPKGAPDNRPGRPVVLGPPLLPLHSCRPGIRAAAGLGVRADRPATAAGACRHHGWLRTEQARARTETLSVILVTDLPSE